MESRGDYKAQNMANLNNNGKGVVLLDIDDTLVFGSPPNTSYNQGLIDALKSAGMTQVFLFSSMRMGEDFTQQGNLKDPDGNFRRIDLIRYLETQNIEVCGLITQADAAPEAEFGQFYEAYLSLCNNSDLTKEGKEQIIREWDEHFDKSEAVKKEFTTTLLPSFRGEEKEIDLTRSFGAKTQMMRRLIQCNPKLAESKCPVYFFDDAWSNLRGAAMAALQTGEINLNLVKVEKSRDLGQQYYSEYLPKSANRFNRKPKTPSLENVRANQCLMTLLELQEAVKASSNTSARKNAHTEFLSKLEKLLKILQNNFFAENQPQASLVAIYNALQDSYHEHFNPDNTSTNRDTEGMLAKQFKLWAAMLEPWLLHYEAGIPLDFSTVAHNKMVELSRPANSNKPLDLSPSAAKKRKSLIPTNNPGDSQARGSDNLAVREADKDHVENPEIRGSLSIAGFMARSDRESAKEQAQRIFDELKKMHSNNPDQTIGLIFSANNVQALAIHAARMKGDKIPDIRGGGQAAVFGELAKLINRDDLESNILIYPVATSLRGGNDVPGNQVSVAHVDRDLAHIAVAVGNDVQVLGIPTIEYDNKFAIGGGVSKNWGNARKEFGDQQSPDSYTQARLVQIQTIANSEESKDTQKIALNSFISDANKPGGQATTNNSSFLDSQYPTRLSKISLYFRLHPVKATLLTLGAILGVAAFVTATVFTAGAFAGAAFATGAIGTAAASGGALAFMFGSVNALAISAGVTALLGGIVARVSSARLWSKRSFENSDTKLRLLTRANPDFDSDVMPEMLVVDNSGQQTLNNAELLQKLNLGGKSNTHSNYQRYLTHHEAEAKAEAERAEAERAEAEAKAEAERVKAEAEAAKAKAEAEAEADERQRPPSPTK